MLTYVMHQKVTKLKELEGEYAETDAAIQVFFLYHPRDYERRIAASDCLTSWRSDARQQIANVNRK